jgi:hypothetical protein
MPGIIRRRVAGLLLPHPSSHLKQDSHKTAGVVRCTPRSWIRPI